MPLPGTARKSLEQIYELGKLISQITDLETQVYYFHVLRSNYCRTMISKINGQV